MNLSPISGPPRARIWARIDSSGTVGSHREPQSSVLADGVMLCVPALPGSTPVTLPALMGVNFLFGTSSQLVNVTMMAVRQAVTPLHMQGRVVATINFAGMVTPLGSLLGGFLAVRCGLRTSLLLTAARTRRPEASICR